MSSFDVLMERYQYAGIDALEDWDTADLVELEGMVSAELQDRAYRRSHILEPETGL